MISDVDPFFGIVFVHGANSYKNAARFRIIPSRILHPHCGSTDTAMFPNRRVAHSEGRRTSLTIHDLDPPKRNVRESHEKSATGITTFVAMTMRTWHLSVARDEFWIWICKFFF